MSPGGKQIAFVADRGATDDVFVISSNGKKEVQLTRSPEDEEIVGWRPNGKQLLFSRFASGISHHFAIDLDGKNERGIGSVAGQTPIISPDGKRIMYMAGTWTASKLMVSSLDGSNALPLTDGTTVAWTHRWGPDGKRIAFTSRKNATSELTLFVMNSDRTELSQVTHFGAGEHAQWGVWSPDGRRLAFQLNKPKEETGCIWSADLATGATRQLTAHDQPYLDETPSWFPDGNRIAFQSNRTGRMEVRVMNADGSEQHQVPGTRT